MANRRAFEPAGRSNHVVGSVGHDASHQSDFIGRNAGSAVAYPRQADGLFGAKFGLGLAVIRIVIITGREQEHSTAQRHTNETALFQCWNIRSYVELGLQHSTNNLRDYNKVGEAA